MRNLFKLSQDLENITNQLNDLIEDVPSSVMFQEFHRDLVSGILKVQLSNIKLIQYLAENTEVIEL